ncbi:MAG: hypothetical protein L3J03_10385 [Desulfobacterales bacterium]|nr:hypothetical protein [Desulfobacterales bacterium]
MSWRKRGQPALALFLPGFLLLLAGCAGFQPKFERPPAREGRAVAAAFAAAGNHRCGSSLDAEVAVTASFFSLTGGRTGRISGYLLAGEPSLLKFVAVNPLGQPLLVFVSDGHRFQTVLVAEGKGYEGAIRSRTVQRYMPAGFVDQPLFPWLVGHVSPVTEVEVLGRDPAGKGYWLTFPAPDGINRNLLLFDPAARLVRRRILENHQGKTLLDVHYEDYRPVGREECRLPGIITVNRLPHNTTLIIEMMNMEPAGPGLTAADFVVTLPPGFERVEVR